MEDSGQGDVVDVMPGGVSQGPILPPAGAPEHEPRLAGEANVGTEAQPLHHTWAKALDEGVGALDEAENGLHALRALEVDPHARASAVEYLPNHRDVVVVETRRGTFDPQHVRPHVGQHHGGKRPRTSAGDLNDLQAFERTHGVPA
jgi:hypothetical protein